MIETEDYSIAFTAVATKGPWGVSALTATLSYKGSSKMLKATKYYPDGREEDAKKACIEMLIEGLKNDR